MDKKLLTIQDLSCVGQCSLTVALPILSAYGLETCVLPTAVLSNHTMFKQWSYLDLTPEVDNIYANWKVNGFKFDAFLLGYLGKATLMDAAERAFDEFSAEGALIVIDPVFADNGKLYGGFDMAYVKAMAHLVRRAHIILPNLTEACFMTGIEYKTEYDRAYVEEVLAALSKLTGAVAVVTGVELDGKIGEAIKDGDKISYVMGEKLPKSSHGTGDIFASVFTAEYLGGATLDEKIRLLIAYLRKMNDDLNIPHGIKFYGADSYPCAQGFVPEAVFLERLSDIARNAIGDACTGSNPRQPSQEEMERLLKCCYYDAEVDF